MKKFGFCLLALCLVGYVAGCGNKETTDPAPNPTPPATEEGTAGDTTPPVDPVDEGTN